MDIAQKQIKKRKFFYIAINAVIFLIVFILGEAYPFTKDDLWLMKNFSTGELNTGFCDAFISSWDFYMNWTGKFFTTLIASIFVIHDKTAYNLCNAAMHLFLCNTIYQFAKRKKYDVDTLLMIWISIWIFVPRYGDFVLWTDVSVEYQWGLVPILIFILLYYKYGFDTNNNNYKQTDTKKIVIKCIGIFLLAFFAGCSLEATGCAVIFGIIVYIFIKVKTKSYFQSWQIAGICGFIAGFLFLMLAPGNYNRAEKVETLSERRGLYEMVFRFLRTTYYGARYIMPIFGISLFLILLSYHFCSNKDESLDDEKNSKIKHRYLNIVMKEGDAILFVVLAIISVYVIIFTPAFANRIYFTPAVFMIISSLISLKKIYGNVYTRIKDGGAISCGKHILLAFLVIFVLAQMFTAYIATVTTGEPFIKDVYYTESFQLENLIQ